MKRARNGKGSKRKRVKTSTVSFYAGTKPRRRTKTELSNVELKFFDTDIVDANIDATMTFFNPQILIQGDKETERIGRKVIIKSLSIKGELKLNAQTTATTTGCLITMKVVHDSQTNKAQFAATDLLAADTFDSFNNISNKNRFRILKSCTYEFSAGGAAPSGAALIFSQKSRYVDEHLKMNIPIEYDATAATGAITTVTSNSIFVVFQSSTTNLVSSNMKMRIRYTD